MSKAALVGGCYTIGKKCTKPATSGILVVSVPEMITECFHLEVRMKDKFDLDFADTGFDRGL